MSTLILKRLINSKKEDFTIGELLILSEVNTHICYTLERGTIGAEPNRNYAIPAGAYSLELYNSQKFGEELIRVYNSVVPSKRSILIHAGNSVKDTQGCILVGELSGNAKMPLKNSRAALDMFNALVLNYQFGSLIIDDKGMIKI